MAIWIDDLIRDSRLALRSLRRTPAFTLASILSLALAAGAAAAIFSIVDGVLLRPLPFAAPDRLVRIYAQNWTAATAQDEATGPLGSAQSEAFLRESRLLDGLAGYEVTTAHLDEDAGVERLTAVIADQAFFNLLGVAPLAGRTFEAGDAPDVAVISANLWQRRFAGDRTIVGKAIALNGRRITVIGIMPPAFQYPFGAASLLPGTLPEGRTDVWLLLPPLRDPATGAPRRGRLSVTARLKPGVSIAAAAAELDAIAAAIPAPATTPTPAPTPTSTSASSSTLGLIRSAARASAAPPAVSERSLAAGASSASGRPAAGATQRERSGRERRGPAASTTSSSQPPPSSRSSLQPPSLAREAERPRQDAQPAAAAPASAAPTRPRVRVVALSEVVARPIGRALWLLFAAVGLVVVAACANVANLQAARMAERTREVVTRAALGATRPRLVRQFLVESLVLALAGGLAGLAIAFWGTRILVALASTMLPRAHEIAVAWRTFAFLLVLCAGTAVLSGLVPALAAARVDLQAAMKEGGQATTGRRFARLRDMLVIVEVALAFVLACGAALVVREVSRLRGLPTGMVMENVLTLHLSPGVPASNYYAIEQQVAGLAGVRAAGFTQLLPLQNWGWDAAFAIRSGPHAGAAAPGDPPRRTGLRYVTPGYFASLGIPILRGRSFTTQDVEGAPRVVLINAAFARRYFAGDDPVGRELDRGTIVGVTGDVSQAGLDRAAEPELYYPAAQNVTMASDIGMSLVVRTAGRPEPLIDAVRASVRTVNPRLAIFRVKTMQEVVNDSLRELRLYRWLVGLFAVLALTLAAIGLSGVTACSVSSRLRELAVRLSLGAAPPQIARMVLLRALRLTAIGLAIGLALALAAMPALRHFASGLRGDAATYAAVAALLLAMTLAAGVLPALRGAAVDPARALRND